MDKTGLVIRNRVPEMCVLLDIMENHALRDVVKIATQAAFVTKSLDNVRTVKLVCMDHIVPSIVAFTV